MPTAPRRHNQDKLDERRRERDRLRSSQVYDSEWRKTSRQFLRENPFCALCRAKNLLVQATVTDHVEPLWSNPSRRLDPTNFQALCRPCNGRKIATDKKKFAARVR
jgi:5-methylcytosine-specific restriction protein A